MIPAFLQPYSKLVVGIIGIAVIIGMNRFGVQNADVEGLMIGLARDSIIGALTSWGIYQVTNKPAGDK